MNLANKLREMIQDWRDKEYDGQWQKFRHRLDDDELMKLGCLDCANDLEELLDCNPKIDDVEV